MLGPKVITGAEVKNQNSAWNNFCQEKAPICLIVHAATLFRGKCGLFFIFSTKVVLLI
jgi:hypothetical protein